MSLAGWNGEAFAGTRLAALSGDALLVYRRDDGDDLPFPGLLDLPGGGRKGDESPAACALRELGEAFGLHLPVERVHYARAYLLGDGATTSWFLAVHIDDEEVAAVHFGDEGQDWALMPAADFIADADALPRLRDWLEQYLAADAAIRYMNTVS